jgi:pilus assembly protein Flp/PilA
LAACISVPCLETIGNDRRNRTVSAVVAKWTGSKNWGNSELGEAKMKKQLMRLWNEQEGQDLTEYALLLVLIALAAITVMGTLGSAINNVFSTASSTLTSANT